MTHCVRISALSLLAVLCACSSNEKKNVDAGPPVDANADADGLSPADIPVDLAGGDLAPEPADLLTDHTGETVDGVGELSELETADGSGALQGSWVQLKSPQLGEHVLKGVWGWDDGNVVAVGEAGLVAALVQSAFVPAFQDPSLNILNGVWGSHSQDIWTVGMYGLVYHYDGEEWAMPSYCVTVEDCSFAGECLLGKCMDNSCEYTPTGKPGCCGGDHFKTTLDAPGDAGLFTIADLYAGTPDGGINWQVVSVVGANGEPRHVSAPNALYFGDVSKNCSFNPQLTCPDYNNGKKVGGTATSPPITLPATSETVTFNFQLYIDVEASPFADVLKVRVLNSGKWEDAWNKSSLSGNFPKSFIPIQVDLSKYLGKTIRVQFYFDSVSPENNALEGIYVDNIGISSTCSIAGALAGKFPTLWSVWGASADRVFAVGSEGWVLRYDGQSWQKQAGGETYEVLGIHGASASDVVLVGNGGLVLHSLGTGWEEEASGTTKKLTRVWGTSPDRYVAIGPSGALTVFNGTKWTQSSEGGFSNLNGIIGFADDEYYIVGQTGKYLQYNGTSFLPVNSPSTANFHGVWGEDNSNMMVVGDKTVLSGPANGLQQETVPIVTNWKAVWGVDGHRYVTGEYGKMLHYDGSQWEKMDSGVETVLWDLWGFATDDIYAVGEGATILHWDGDKWEKMKAIGPEEAVFYDVWGSGPEDVYVVALVETEDGNLNYTLHFDGKSWKVALSSTVADLRHVHGTTEDNVFAAGQGGTIVHFDGKGWGLSPIDPYIMEDGSEYYVTQNLYGVFAMSDDDAWAVGEGGVIVHYDGISFSLGGIFDYTLRAVYGISPKNLWAVGNAGVIFRFDGQQWYPEESGTVASLYALWGDKAGHIYAVGDNGVILTYVTDE